MSECKYCGGRIRRKKFETNDLFASRDYCDQPKCLRRGRQERLEVLYAKDEPEAMRNHSRAFITRALFLMRWGMEPMEAFDRYGHEASLDWERLFFSVSAGQGIKFTITVSASDGNQQPIINCGEEEYMLIDDLRNPAQLVNTASDMVTAAHQKLLESLGNAETVDTRTNAQAEALVRPHAAAKTAATH